jgi:hypothetical protein
VAERWRVGRSIGRTVYPIDGTQPVAVALGAEDEARQVATRIVDDHNSRQQVDELVRAAWDVLECDPPSDLSRRSDDDAYRAARMRLRSALALFPDPEGEPDGTT